jgi:hypothetical protein
MRDKEAVKNRVLAVLEQHRPTSFSDDELDRVFKSCVAPAVCKRVVLDMVSTGELTVQSIKQLPPKGV